MITSGERKVQNGCDGLCLKATNNGGVCLAKFWKNLPLVLMIKLSNLLANKHRQFVDFPFLSSPFEVVFERGGGGLWIEVQNLKSKLVSTCEHLGVKWRFMTILVSTQPILCITDSALRDKFIGVKPTWHYYPFTTVVERSLRVKKQNNKSF